MNNKWLIGAAAAVGIVLVAAALVSQGRERVASPQSAEATAAVPAGAPTATAQPGIGEQEVSETQPSAPASEAPPSGAPAATPSHPAEKGEKLLAITTPPPRTLALVEKESATANARYEVEFEPYGLAQGGGIVVRVTKSTAIGHVDKIVDFSDRNVLVRLASPEVAEAIAKGGTYSGVLELREEMGVLAPRLLSAELDE